MQVVVVVYRVGRPTMQMLMTARARPFLFLTFKSPVLRKLRGMRSHTFRTGGGAGGV